MEGSWVSSSYVIETLIESDVDGSDVGPLMTDKEEFEPEILLFLDEDEGSMWIEPEKLMKVKHNHC